MTGRMRDPAFRQTQRDGLYAPHIAPVNTLVDHLAGHGRGWLPHVAPVHGGTAARVPWILRDPGPADPDPDHDQAGFLCVENDDPTARRLCALLDQAGIDTADTMPWNVYPWYINRKPRADERRAGVPPLRRLLKLLTELRVVLLLGDDAHKVWDLLTAAHPTAAAGQHVLRTRHTSTQAFIGTADKRDAWRGEQEAVFRQAAALLPRQDA